MTVRFNIAVVRILTNSKFSACHQVATRTCFGATPILDFLTFDDRHFCYKCGNSIIKSALAREIKIATSAHYRQCNLFEYS